MMLTLARRWQTATTGKFIAKDTAATWAMPHLPEPMTEVLTYAREAYLGRANDDRGNRPFDARQMANHPHQQVIAALTA
ncbi:DUF4111 domain-containing protein [Mesorhizobium sp. BAC0120]|uniref:aminoglycoside adenylyltransferase domain-containing protein n=1 Tax=Mesorhizobium sp. BAC0120 TaxID=3090670 RepID=UPI00298BDBF9|nr:aminoglycoside adenylyltransferase domain-containing protein [Mesorhizobium sp. BAC0120]MDW6026634.1 DUF4111 domain-containing protein [Mesorhizobium sp. BAC0120]